MTTILTVTLIVLPLYSLLLFMTLALSGSSSGRIVCKNVCGRAAEVSAHRGNADRDPGIPVLGPHAVAVFTSGLQSHKHKTHGEHSG